MRKESKYINLTFNKKAEFDKWLKETSYKTIWFKDNGQDLLKIWVAESGEILHANTQARIWNGKFIDMENISEGKNIRFWNKELQEWDEKTFEIALIRSL